jgi:hypothetical protein
LRKLSYLRNEMSPHQLLVVTDPVPGKEDEVHDWHNGVHIPESLPIAGFAGATFTNTGEEFAAGRITTASVFADAYRSKVA